MPWITHRSAGELGKTPISSNQFFFVYQSVMRIYLFVFLVKQIE
jgi:hypothetical protein